MKKKLVITTIVALSMVFTACGSSGTKSSSDSTTVTEAGVEDSSQAATAAEADELKSQGVMTYDEYAAADLDTEVVVETYVQAKQSWWDNKATLYTQDQDGAYFIYGMECSEEDYDKLAIGTKIKITGYKSEWSGEVEIVDASFEIEDGNYIAEACDVTEYLGTDTLEDYQNQFVSFTGMTVEAKEDGSAFYYNYDNSGAEGDDLYFDLSYNGEKYTFTVESYLTDADTDVYKAVKALNVGDTVDLEGFLYWYEGANPHITKITVK